MNGAIWILIESLQPFHLVVCRDFIERANAA